MAVVVIGCWEVAPRLYRSPDHSMWWVPGAVVASTVPFVAMALLSAPYVCAIRVFLPPSAKKSTAALMRFAENVPGETKIALQTMRWLPWPTHHEMYFCDLRRLSGTKLSVNLEHLPLGHERAREANNIVGGRLAMRMYGRYWVDMTARNRSQAPGVWEKMWDQIPIKGQEPVKIADRKPVSMSNRPAPAKAKQMSPPSPRSRLRNAKR